MQGLNKVIGGLLGFLVAGFKGGLLGIFIGHVFDRHLVDSTSHSGWNDFWLEAKRRARLHEGQKNDIKKSITLELKQAYELLKISEDATQIEVKQAYRKSINRYHPDRLALEVRSKKQLQKAAQRLQQIREAYELICQTKNFS